MSATAEILSHDINLGENYQRIKGGCNLQPRRQPAGLVFCADDVAQLTISLDRRGQISVHRGAGLELIALTQVHLLPMSQHYLEWDISIGHCDNYGIYLGHRSVVLLSGKADTQPDNANAWVNRLIIFPSDLSVFQATYIYLPPEIWRSQQLISAIS